MPNRSPFKVESDIALYLNIMVSLTDRAVDQICARQDVKPAQALPIAASLVLKSVDLMNEKPEMKQHVPRIFDEDVALANALLAIGYGRELKPHERILSGNNPPTLTLEDIREKLRAYMKARGISPDPVNP